MENSVDLEFVVDSPLRLASPSQTDFINEIDEALSHLIKDFMAHLYHLRGDQVIDDATFHTTVLSVCLFCGAADE